MALFWRRSEEVSNHCDLFNSVPSNDELKEILQTINVNLCPDDLSKVAEVDSITVNKAINKLRLGKSDSKYNFGSDAFIHGSNALSEKLAFLFQTFLIHGFVPVFLLVCTLVPIIKDKLGNQYW